MRITAKVEVTGQAGNVLDLSEGMSDRDIRRGV